MAIVIAAFDGLIARTLDLRADALEAALHAEQLSCPRADVLGALPGRTVAEAVALLLGESDATQNDLVVLRAQQTYSSRIAHGLLLAPDARDWLRAERAAGHRIVLRADSARRDVTPVLELMASDADVAFVCCADDVPRRVAHTSLDGAYTAIMQRLGAFRTSTECIALEFSTYAAEIARRYVDRAAHAEQLPRVQSTGPQRFGGA